METLLAKENLELAFRREEIEQRVRQLAMEVNRDFAGQSIVLIGVLKGAAIFLADFLRCITVECMVDFLTVSSYRGELHLSGSIRLLKTLDISIENRNVLLIEDILDTGATLCYLQNLLLRHGPAMLKIMTLLDKPARRVEEIEADYVGFTIPNRYVVGYGMDFAERYRNLPDIYFAPILIQEEWST